MCLGLSYEKSGTLLVPMIMHAVFNAISVTAILFFL
jgi:membrane protease YdiL (CAAX protease family)